MPGERSRTATIARMRPGDQVRKGRSSSLFSSSQRSRSRSSPSLPNIHPLSVLVPVRGGAGATLVAVCNVQQVDIDVSVKLQESKSNLYISYVSGGKRLVAHRKPYTFHIRSTATAQERTVYKTALMLAAVLAALTGCTVPSNGTVTMSTETVTVTEPSTFVPGHSGLMETDGMYVIGKDIQPGTYKSAPTHTNNYPFCTWKRLSDYTGASTGIIAIDNQPGQTIVTIAPTDLAFQTLGCQPWSKIG
jgi:hypothetical protein